MKKTKTKYKNIVTLYMKAIGKEKLSIECWKRIAKVNSIVLSKK